MSRFLPVALFAALTLTAPLPAVVTPSAAQPKPVTSDFVLNVGLTHPVAMMEKEFVDEVKKRTNGQLDIVMRPPGELPYKLPEYLRVVGQGNVQMGDVYMGFLAGDTKIAVLTGLPFLVGTADELKKVMVVLEPMIREDFARFGADVLTWFTWPEQNFFERGKPITTLEDFKGRKIRITSPEQSELVKRLGAVPVSIPAPEVPSAAQRAVMEGHHRRLQTAGLELVRLHGDGRTCPDIHIGWPAYILINKQALAALPAEHRKILQETAAALQAKMLRQIPPGPERSQDPSSSSTRSTDPGQARGVVRAGKLMDGYWDEWAKQSGPKTVEALAQVKKVHGR